VYIVADYLVRNLISSLDDFINDYKAPFGLVVESYFLFLFFFLPLFLMPHGKYCYFRIKFRNPDNPAEIAF
jgi:hypothetical protein